VDDSSGESCHEDRATDIEHDDAAQPTSSNTGRCVVVTDNSCTSDHTQVMEYDSRGEAEAYRDWHHHEERKRPSVLQDHIATDAEEDRKVVSPPTLSNTVTESDSDAAVSRGCTSVSLSYCSPDSGVYSKAVSDSLTTSQSTVTEPLGVTADLCASTDDRLSGPNASAAKVDDDSSFNECRNNDPQHQTACDTLLSLTEVVQSTRLDDDVDDGDDDTAVDVRSSIMSTNTDDEVSETVVGAGMPVPAESLRTAVAPTTFHQRAKCEGVLSSADDVCPPADRHLSCLGSQELSGVSDSDAEDDAVLKTVVAVRTKPVDHTECADSTKPFELVEKLDDIELQKDGTSNFISRGEISVKSVEERLLCDEQNVDDSQTECSDLQPVNVSDGTVNDLQAENHGKDTGGDNAAVDLVDEGNHLTQHTKITPTTIEQHSSLSTELDQYVTEYAPQATETSCDSQTLDAASNGSQQLSDLIANVKIFSEDDDLRIYSADRRSHSHTRSFTNANYSLPTSRSPSPESLGCNKTRRHSCTLSSPQPPDIVDQVCDLSVEHRNCEVLQNVTTPQQIPLTASIEDLKLRPSRKKLEFDGLARESLPSLFLEPPDEYRDDPRLTENIQSFIPSKVTDLSVDELRPQVDFNMQAKKDHLERYLKSLAAVPGCDSVQDTLHSGLSQEGHICFQDVGYGGRLDGDATGLPCHEHSSLLLVPDRLHQSDNLEEFTEDEHLELQLQQYEVMKRRLMEEHRRSLEQLLAEQERQVLLLQSRLMAQTVFSRSSRHTGTMAQKPIILDQNDSDSERCKSNPLPVDIPVMLDRQKSVSMMQNPSHNTVGQDQENISSPDQRRVTLVGDGTSSGHKMRSPAGVFYNDEQFVNGEAMTRSDDAESEFAYESPAVLRSSRRITPTCSPHDASKTDVEPARHRHHLMPAQDNHPLSSTDPHHSPVHGRTLHRRYVDVFSEASLQDFNS